MWTIATSGERPNDGLQVVSSLQLEDTVQYRVLGVPDACYNAQPAEPSLEDGYMWLMNQAHV